MKANFLCHCHYWYLKREFDVEVMKAFSVQKGEILLQEEKQHQESFEP